MFSALKLLVLASTSLCLATNLTAEVERRDGDYAGGKVRGYNRRIYFCRDHDAWTLEHLRVDLDPHRVGLQEIDPMPMPVRGKPLTITATGVTNRDISGGRVQVHINGRMRFGNLNMDKEFDLCEVVKEGGMPCPMKKGAFRLEKTFDVPRIAPTMMDIRLVVYDDMGERITCIEGEKFELRAYG